MLAIETALASNGFILLHFTRIWSKQFLLPIYNRIDLEHISSLDGTNVSTNQENLHVQLFLKKLAREQPRSEKLQVGVETDVLAETNDSSKPKCMHMHKI